jgi:hypothetical protein
MYFISSGTKNYHSKIMQESSDTFSLSYPFQNAEIESFKFNVNNEREVKFIYWEKIFFGKIQVVIIDKENGMVTKKFTTHEGYNYKKIKLQKGNYITKLKTNLVMGGFVIGYDNMPSDLNPLKDSDNDGLHDEYENKNKTNLNSKDTDGDGLSDYEEIFKYHTNPLMADSDHDGKIDSDWDERREYAYTIQALVDLRVPYNLADMTDSFQDARLIKINKNVSRVEVILYPEASVLINPSKYKKVSNKYTTPTYTKNYSSTMRKDITKIIGKSKTDLQVVLKLIKELTKIKAVDIVKDLKMNTDIPLDFTLVKDQNNIHVSPERKSSMYSIDEIQKKYCLPIQCIKVRLEELVVLLLY